MHHRSLSIVGFMVLTIWVHVTAMASSSHDQVKLRPVKLDISLGDQVSRLTVESTGRIDEIQDLLTQYRVAWSSAPGRLAWVIRCATGEIVTSNQYPSPTVERKANEICFRWKANALPRVTGRIRFDSGQGEFLITSVIEDVGKRNIAEFEYPTGMTVSTAPGNYLIAAGSQGEEQAARLYELDTMKTELALMYPGIMQMQMVGFKLGASSLLVYTNDTESKIKWHYFRPVMGGLEHRLVHIPRLTAGREPWKEPYAVVYKVISNGGYNELAQGYAEWARGRAWAAVKVADKVKRCPLLKRYMEDGCIRMHIPSESRYTFGTDNRWHYQKKPSDQPVYEATLAMMDRFEKTTGCRPGYWWPTWAGHAFDTAYPDYFPVAEYMGDFDRFKAEMIRAGRPIMYHMNMAHWVTYRPSYRKEWMATWGGQFWDCIWNKTAHRYTSPDLTLPKEMQNIDRIADTAGTNGSYLDVLGAVFLEDDNPRSRFAKTPNNFQLARNQTFRAIRKKLTGPIMTESRNEAYLASVDFDFGYIGGPQDDPLPLWQMVYGDCALLMPYIDKYNSPSYIHLACTYGGILEVPFDSNSAWLSWMQRVLSHVVGRRMVRYDRTGEYRISQWDTGTAIWRRPVPGDSRPKDAEFSTVAGAIAVKNQSPDSLLVWTGAGDFIAIGLGEFKINDVKAFRTESLNVRFIRYRNTVFVHNPTSEKVQVRFFLYDEKGREFPIKCLLEPQASEKFTFTFNCNK